jgi:HSP20 family protein
MTVIRKPLGAVPLDLAFLQREVNQLLERLADLDRGDTAVEGDWVPAVDVFECRGQLTLVAEVPGLVPESLKVVFRDRHLVISGDRRERRPAAGQASFLCMERPQGRFTRSVRLDVPVDVKEAEARLAQGLLTVTVPRLKDRRGREAVVPVRREEGP